MSIPTSAQEYRIRPGGLNDIRKQALKTLLPFILLVLLIAPGIGYVTSGTIFSASEYLEMGAPMAVLLLIGILIGLGRQKKFVNSYVLTIDNILLRRVQISTPDVEIYFNEIIEISKNKNGWLIVKGKYAGDIIYIPAQLEKFD